MNKIWQRNLRATSAIDNNMHAHKNQSYYCSKRSHTSTWLLSLTWTPLTNKVFCEMVIFMVLIIHNMVYRYLFKLLTDSPNNSVHSY